MLFDCDTCDAVYDSAEDCQAHMNKLGHAASSDRSDARSPERAVFVSSRHSASSILAISDANGTQTCLPTMAFDDDDFQSIRLSSLYDPGNEQGVRVPTFSINHFAEPERNPVTFTKEWVAAQQVSKGAPPPLIESAVYYKCGACPVTFTIWAEYEQHMIQLLHWACQDPKCDMKCDSWNNVSAHMTAKKHWGPGVDSRSPPFEDHRTHHAWPCTTCSTLFSSKRHVERHMNAQRHWIKQQVQILPIVPTTSVLKQDVFQMQAIACACGRAFKSMTAANAHKLDTKHGGELRERPCFGCRRCERLFVTVAQCVEHIVQTNHLNAASSFTCQFCGSNFSTKNGLGNHQESKHPNNQIPEKNVFKATSGPYASTRAAAVKVMKSIAKKNASFECESCDVIFESKEAVRQHMKIKKHYDWQTQHLRQTQGQGYQCNSCSSTFLAVESVLQHIAAKHRRKKGYFV